MPQAVYPRARIRAYPLGAEGYTTDAGWAMYSPMARDFGAWYGQGGYPWGAGVGTPYLRAHECITLGNDALVIPRICLYLQHTESAQWTQDSGTWEEEGIFGGFAWTGLHDYVTTGQLTSVFTVPESPNFCIAIFTPGYELGWDVEADPPYMSIQWGPTAPAGAEKAYELRVWHDGALEVFELSAGGGRAQLGAYMAGWEWPKGETQGKWLWLMVCHLKGGLAIRKIEETNWYFFQNSTTIAPPAGNFVFYHRGSQAYFMLHSLLGPNPSIGSTSTVLPLYSEIWTADRIRAANPTAEGRYLVPAPATTDVAPDLDITPIDHTGTDDVEVQVDFTWGYYQVVGGGQADAAMAYTFPYFPELYAVQARFDPVVNAPSLIGMAEIWSDKLETADLQLSNETEASRVSFSGLWRIQDAVFTDYLAGCYLDIAFGWHYDDESNSVLVYLTGYADSLELTQEDPNHIRLGGAVSDCSVRLRSCECDNTWPAMDGWDAEDAALYTAAKLGWDATRCSLGALTGIFLSEGRPEEPLWQAKPGQSPWDFLQHIARYCLQEITVDASGNLVARALAYFNVAVSTSWPTTVLLTPPGVRVNRRNIWSYTGVQVKGRALDGTELIATRYDPDAENNPAYAFYKGYRRLEVTEDFALLIQGDVDDLADCLYTSLLQRIGDEVSWTVDMNLSIVRRQCAYITGTGGIINDVLRLGITGITHHFGPRLKDCKSSFTAVPYPV